MERTIKELRDQGLKNKEERERNIIEKFKNEYKDMVKALTYKIYFDISEYILNIDPNCISYSLTYDSNDFHYYYTALTGKEFFESLCNYIKIDKKILKEISGINKNIFEMVNENLQSYGLIANFKPEISIDNNIASLVKLNIKVNMDFYLCLDLGLP